MHNESVIHYVFNTCMYVTLELAALQLLHFPVVIIDSSDQFREDGITCKNELSQILLPLLLEKEMYPSNK